MNCCKTIHEDWDTIEDAHCPGLSAFQVSSLGRVRRQSSGRVIQPVARSLEDGRPLVRLYVRKRRFHRSIRSLVTQAFSAAQAEVAVAAVMGGVTSLVDLREDLLERLSQIDEAIGVLAFQTVPSRKDPEPELAASPSLRDCAILEARRLGEIVREFLDVDPITMMTRAEKLSRLARLRGTYGEVIEVESQIPIGLGQGLPSPLALA